MMAAKRDAPSVSPEARSILSVGPSVARGRRARKWTPAQVANAMTLRGFNVTPEWVRAIERGMPLSPAEAEALERTLGLPVNALLEPLALLADSPQKQAVHAALIRCATITATINTLNAERLRLHYAISKALSP